MLSLLFVSLLAQPPAPGAELSAESPAVVAQRAAAEGLEAQSMYGDARHAYVFVASRPARYLSFIVSRFIRTDERQGSFDE